MKYFETRQNQTGQTEDQLEPIFKSLADTFSYKWLKTAGAHPLQQLWMRRDALATNELFAFGDAVLRVKAIDAKWIAEQAKLVKTDHVNNRNGAMFEINAVGMLATAKQEVKPAQGNNPGFDATLKLSGDKSMRVSLKNYGDSAHYKTFNGYAGKFEARLVELLKMLNIPSVQIIIEKVGTYPEKQDWQELTDHMEAILRGYSKGNPQLFGIEKKWAVVLSTLKDGAQPFHPAFNSYTLIIASSYHKNEHKNLLDKLDEAAANLVKHSKGETDQVCNIVFVHLPESASITACKEWADSYLQNYPDKPLTGIILYQPVVASDPSNDRNFIHHGFQMVFNLAKYNTWNTEGVNLSFSLPVGVLNSEPSVNAVMIEKDGIKEKLNYPDKYFFQRGNLYLDSVKDAQGNIHGNIQRYASGVFSHSVFQPFPDQPAMLMSGRFAPVDKLLVL